jgi:hypothetical protein
MNNNKTINGSIPKFLRVEPLLNSKTTFSTKTNSFYNKSDPRQGILYIGNNGIEFRELIHRGFIKLPWKNIRRIRVQLLFFNKVIRGFFVDTDSNQVFDFAVSKAKQTVQHIATYIGKDKIIRAGSTLNHK